MKGENGVAVLIINWNGADDTIELLRSLRGAAEPNLSLTASVIDNASDDGDFSKLASFLESAELGFPVVLIRNRNNVGVPFGYNQAIQSAGLDCDAYLRLDNDVVLPAGAIDVLLQTLTDRRKDAVGIVGGNVKYCSAPEIDNGGAVAINLVAGKTVTTYPSVVTVCDGVLGCVMLVDGDLVRAFAPQVFCSEPVHLHRRIGTEPACAPVGSEDSLYSDDHRLPQGRSEYFSGESHGQLLLGAELGLSSASIQSRARTEGPDSGVDRGLLRTSVDPVSAIVRVRLDGRTLHVHIALAGLPRVRAWCAAPSVRGPPMKTAFRRRILVGFMRAQRQGGARASRRRGA